MADEKSDNPTNFKGYFHRNQNLGPNETNGVVMRFKTRHHISDILAVHQLDQSCCSVQRMDEFQPFEY